ncbi:MAG TPA: enolase C-terminal domain-like protein, partial [Thermomicrobiales bacterium]|nr:enolase C-terminal domain-like protein [Thermomicrobiales bacterium]
ERTIEISRYAHRTTGPGTLTTSLVAVQTDVRRNGELVVGYGFSSVGRYGQGGLIRERFGPRLIEADGGDLQSEDGTNIDPTRAWDAMMAHEKPGGHGERCVAVGTLDMAIWDAAAKIADLPLHQFLAQHLGKNTSARAVPVYASGGYRFREDDQARLVEELTAFANAGFTRVKMKVGSGALLDDLERVEVARDCLPDDIELAVDAMNAYQGEEAVSAAEALRSLELAWFEDVCDPHDFATQRAVTAIYEGPLAAGEALFSAGEARLLADHGGMRPDRDKLVFDPVHTYGLPGYLRIVGVMTEAGWPLEAFWPHGGHLFSLHLASAMGLAGAEVTPRAFAPFNVPPSGAILEEGTIALPTGPGIGFESQESTKREFHRLIGT